MHPELERLQREYGWRPTLVANETIPTLFHAASVIQVATAYSDSHTADRADLDGTSWWYQTRNRIIIQALRTVPSGTAIWDIGCGTGVVSAALRSTGHQIVGIEPSRAGAEITARTGIPTFHTTLEKLELPSNSLAALSLFDVLEHVQDRQGLLHELHRVLQPDGFLVLTVPALPLLWSQFDDDEAHQLRYTRLTLRNELVKAGFSVETIGYMFALTVLPLLLLRALPYRLGMRKSLSDSVGVAVQGGLLGRLASQIEQSLALRTPFGSSVLAVVRKSEVRTYT
ncbi:MAG: methyltransferase domain-containing protein [Actinobacteria bacterium]|nr:methyltransferase domain-containing protein [Actinomycetota bacterium]